MTISEADHERDWQILHGRITQVLDRYGVRNNVGDGDYWLLDENWGLMYHQLEFQNLDLLQPIIINSLQAALVGFPDWYITIRVDLRDKAQPGMGIVVYPDRIIDDLRREFLPARFRDVVFGAVAADETGIIADRVRRLMNLNRPRGGQ